MVKGNSRITNPARDVSVLDCMTGKSGLLATFFFHITLQAAFGCLQCYCEIELREAFRLLAARYRSIFYIAMGLEGTETGLPGCSICMK